MATRNILEIHEFSRFGMCRYCHKSTDINNHCVCVECHKKKLDLPRYSELIKAEKDDPQHVFNKTFKCPRCGFTHYEGWIKVEEGEFIDDGR